MNFNSNLFLLTLNLTSASRLDPISLDDLFSSIAIFATCLILNKFDHFSLSLSFGTS